MASLVPPLPDLEPASYSVQKVPGTELIVLGFVRPGHAPGGLVLDRADARQLGSRLVQAAGRGAARGAAKPGARRR